MQSSSVQPNEQILLRSDYWFYGPIGDCHYKPSLLCNCNVRICSTLVMVMSCWDQVSGNRGPHREIWRSCGSPWQYCSPIGLLVHNCKATNIKSLIWDCLKKEILGQITTSILISLYFKDVQKRLLTFVSSDTFKPKTPDFS